MEESDDVYIELAENALKILSITFRPGSFMVDLIPMSKHAIRPDNHTDTMDISEALARMDSRCRVHKAC